MLNVAPVALPAESYPDTNVHFQSVHDSYSQHLAGLRMVQIRQPPQNAMQIAGGR